jgi:hypothetical protein
MTTLVLIWHKLLVQACCSGISFLRRPDRTYLDADAALGTNIIVNRYYVIDHADGDYRAQIYAPAASGTFVRINSNHYISPSCPLYYTYSRKLFRLIAYTYQPEVL